MPEYGAPLIGAGWYVGHAVWLRMATGPMLVVMVGMVHGLAEILPMTPDAMPMRVPVERLADNYAEAVRA